MKLEKEDISFNTVKKVYRRQVFHCVTDDVWVMVEVPRESNSA